MAKGNLEKTGFASACHSQVTPPTEGNQGRNLEAGTEPEAMDEHCLLAWSLWLAQPDFLSPVQGGGVTYSDLGPLSGQSSVKTMSHRLAYNLI